MESAQINRAAALTGLARLGEAREIYESLLATNPGNTEIVVALQSCLYKMGDLASMEPVLLGILEADPQNEKILGLLVSVYTAGNDREKLLEYSQKLLDVMFEGPELLWERSALLLKMGDFKEGFKLYENRPSMRLASPFVGPRWSGEPFRGRRLVVHWEQGFGDTIMMLRFGPMLQALGGEVVLFVQPQLLELARTCVGFDRIVSGQTKELEHELHIPTMSLPLALGIEPDTIPAEIPYLGVPPLVKWRNAILERLRMSGAGRRIGLVWAGNKNYKNDHLRSIPPEQLEPLGRAEDATWFSLQRETPDLLPLPGMVGMADLMETFGDTAFLINCMDVVVTVDTMAAHLAGALGKPTILMLPFRSEWRWMAKGSGSPWYPTIRIHRQNYLSDWSEVTEAVCKELNQRIIV
jgi:tetratricopeptide (TPR) repeat protein